MAGTPAPSGPLVYAYAGQSGFRVLRGTETVADVARDANTRVTDAEWTADGSRFVAATERRLFSVDARTGATVTADCRCRSIAVAAGRVFAIDRNASEVVSYDVATLAPAGTVRLDLGQARGLSAIDGAGDRVVTFAITADGARTRTDVVVLEPNTGAVHKVGSAGPVDDTAYTPHGWRGGPMFAYTTNDGVSGSRGVASVVWFDPSRPAEQVVTSDRQLRARTPDVPAENWNSGRAHLWWAADGTLHVTAWTWSCTGGAGAGEPTCVDRVPRTQWRFDGTEWAMTDERVLDTVRIIGGGAVLELSLPAPSGPGTKQLTLIDGPQRSVVATDAIRLWTPPPAAAPSPPQGSQALAERFAPTVWLHEEERRFPADARDFVRQSALRFDHGDICVDAEPVATNLDEVKLGNGDYHHTAGTPGGAYKKCTHPEGGKSFKTDEPVDEGRGGGRGFYLDVADTAHNGNQPGADKRVAAPAYWDYISSHDRGRGAYVYWFFYAYNDFTNNHEGDWERVAVQVEGERPIGVVFWRHGIPVCYTPWENLEVSGGRPVTFSAEGSHASYPRPGSYPGYGTDRTGKGFEWDTSKQVLEVGKQAWYGYRGIWGDLGRLDTSTGVSGPYPKRDMSPALTAEKCREEPARVPEAFVGSWKTLQPVNDPTVAEPYHAEVRISPGAAGEIVGTASYPGLGCDGGWTLTDSWPNKMIVREGRSVALRLLCVASGTIELTTTPTGLRYTYTADGRAETATAELVRT